MISRAAALRRPALILLYHRVALLDDDRWSLAVSPRHFEQQLQVLRRLTSVVPLREIVERLERGDSTRGLAAVTFDDGYADNVATALPLLERHAVPATFFVSSAAVAAGREFWWDELQLLVPEAGAFQRAWERLRDLPDADRRRELDAMRVGAAVPRPSYRPMTPEEVRAIAGREGFEIGSHGRTHTRLGALAEGAQREEIAGSRSDLEAMTGRSVTLFAYPFGREGDYTPQTAAMVAGSGYAAACRSFPASVRREESRYELPRCYVRDWSGSRFGLQLLRWMAR